MNRYWAEISRCAAEHPSHYRFRNAIRPSLLHRSASNRYVRTVIKKFIYPLQVRKSCARCDVVHVLDHSYAQMLADVPTGTAKVAALHDLLPLREPEGLSQSSIDGFRRRVEYLKKADVIVSGSEYSKQEAVELLGIDPERILVSAYGARIPDHTVGYRSSFVSSQPYILSVGSTLRRKRLDVLPAILREARRVLPDIRLVRIGPPLPASIAMEIRNGTGPESLEERGIVDDAELNSLYIHAHALILPSSHEGFGLPVLEAMARGCPVVCTSNTSLPEVGGDAVLYFDLDQPEEAAAGIIRLAESPELREKMISGGLSRAKDFTWERHFTGILGAYDLAISRL